MYLLNLMLLALMLASATFAMVIPTVGDDSSLVKRGDSLAPDVGAEVAEEAIAIIFCIILCLVTSLSCHD